MQVQFMSTSFCSSSSSSYCTVKRTLVAIVVAALAFAAVSARHIVDDVDRSTPPSPSERSERSLRDIAREQRLSINGTSVTHSLPGRRAAQFNDLVQKVTAKLAKRGLDLDKASFVEVCGCDRLVKLYDSFPEPKRQVVDSPVNCQHKWNRVENPDQIPAVHYEVECKNSEKCCRADKGDYNCSPLKHPMVVLRRIDGLSERGCCRYRPEEVQVPLSCVCMQRTSGTLAPTADLPQLPS